MGGQFARLYVNPDLNASEKWTRSGPCICRAKGQPLALLPDIRWTTSWAARATYSVGTRYLVEAAEGDGVYPKLLSYVNPQDASFAAPFTTSRRSNVEVASQIDEFSLWCAIDSSPQWMILRSTRRYIVPATSTKITKDIIRANLSPSQSYYANEKTHATVFHAETA